MELWWVKLDHHKLSLLSRAVEQDVLKCAALLLCDLVTAEGRLAVASDVKFESTACRR